MAIVAGGIAVVLAVLVGASSLTGRRGAEVPVVMADTRPIRVKPENPGGMKIDGAENDVFSGGSDNSNARLAPPAETPDTKALRTGSVPAGPITTAPAAPPRPTVMATSVPTAKATPTVGKAMVQLAALSSEDAARNEWQLLSKKMPDLLNGRQPSYSKTDRDGRVFWRVRTAGFVDVAQARAFCDRVKAKGAGCSVAEF